MNPDVQRRISLLEVIRERLENRLKQCDAAGDGMVFNLYRDSFRDIEREIHTLQHLDNPARAPHVPSDNS